MDAFAEPQLEKALAYFENFRILLAGRHFELPPSVFRFHSDTVLVQLQNSRNAALPRRSIEAQLETQEAQEPDRPMLPKLPKPFVGPTERAFQRAFAMLYDALQLRYGFGRGGIGYEMSWDDLGMFRVQCVVVN